MTPTCIICSRPVLAGQPHGGCAPMLAVVAPHRARLKPLARPAPPFRFERAERPFWHIIGAYVVVLALAGAIAYLDAR